MRKRRPPLPGPEDICAKSKGWDLIEPHQNIENTKDYAPSTWVIPSPPRQSRIRNAGGQGHPVAVIPAKAGIHSRRVARRWQAPSRHKSSPGLGISTTFGSGIL